MHVYCILFIVYLVLYIFNIDHNLFPQEKDRLELRKTFSKHTQTAYCIRRNRTLHERETTVRVECYFLII